MLKKVILVSACLLGIDCNYKGTNNLNEIILHLTKKYSLIPICPEQLGGLPTPRSPQRILRGSGNDVLEERTQVINEENKDVTKNFLQGAFESLKIAKISNCSLVIFKNKSPSCGVTKIYNIDMDGLIEGEGVTCALLKKYGFRILSEEDFERNPKLLETIIK